MNRRSAALTHRSGLMLIGTVAIACLLLWPPSGTGGARGVNALVMLSIFLSATISNIAGFAFSAIAGGSVLHLINDPIEAVKVMIVSSIAIQAYSVLMLWRTIAWRPLLPFLLGGVATIPVGIHILLNASAAAYWKGMGVFLIVYSVAMALRGRPSICRGNVFIDVLAGALGGITGGAAGFPGAFVTIWCGMRGWDKNRQRAMYQPFILAMQLMTLCWLEFAGQANTYDIALLQYAPAALLGANCGLVIFQRLNDQHFNSVIYGLLIVSGISLIIK